MYLLGKAELVIPAWEPDQGWRVLDPDGHVVSAGGKTVIHVTALDLAAALGVPLLGVGQERETKE